MLASLYARLKRLVANSNTISLFLICMFATSCTSAPPAQEYKRAPFYEWRDLGAGTAYPSTQKEAEGLYFASGDLDLIEGIWLSESQLYVVAIIKNQSGKWSNYQYIGVVISSVLENWKPGKVKFFLKESADPSIFTGLYRDGDEGIAPRSFSWTSENVLVVNAKYSNGTPTFIRQKFLKGGPQTAEEGGESSGTCFAVGPAGTLVTNQHVIAGGKSIQVEFPDGNSVPASVIRASEAVDIAILSVKRATPNYLSIIPTRNASLGEQVFTVGYPLGTLLGASLKFTEGSISALSGAGDEAAYMQVSIPIQPGNSGGPVVTFKGEAVGIVTARANDVYFLQQTGALPQGINWAVKSDHAIQMLDSRPKRPPVTSRAEAIKRAQASACRVHVSH